MRLFLICLFCFWSFPVFAGPKALVEGFVSEECIYDPARDRVLEDVHGLYDDVLVLTCHDDYYLKDMMSPEQEQDSLSVCKRRIFEYRQAHDLMDSMSPFMIINGEYDALLTYPEVGKSGVDMALALDTVLPAGLSVQEGRLSITLPDLEQVSQSSQAYDVVLFVYLPVSLKGEGGAVICTNPVKYIETIERWDGQETKLEVELPYKKSAMVAVAVQEAPFGKIRVLETIAIP